MRAKNNQTVSPRWWTASHNTLYYSLRSTARLWHESNPRRYRIVFLKKPEAMINNFTTFYWNDLAHVSLGRYFFYRVNHRNQTINSCLVWHTKRALAFCVWPVEPQRQLFLWDNKTNTHNRRRMRTGRKNKRL